MTGDRGKKRERSESSSKLDIPAAKMARALGTNNQLESMFLQQKVLKKEKKSSKWSSILPILFLFWFLQFCENFWAFELPLI